MPELHDEFAALSDEEREKTRKGLQRFADKLVEVMSAADDVVQSIDYALHFSKGDWWEEGKVKMIERDLDALGVALDALDTDDEIPADGAPDADG